MGRKTDQRKWRGAKERKFANSLKDYLKTKFPFDEFNIKVDPLNENDDWADIVVRRKKDNQEVMLIETKADNSAYNVMGEALWKCWEISDTKKKRVPTFIAVDNDLFRAGGRYPWSTETVAKILRYYKTGIGVLVRKGPRNHFDLISAAKGSESRELMKRLKST